MYLLIFSQPLLDKVIAVLQAGMPAKLTARNAGLAETDALYMPSIANGNYIDAILPVATWAEVWCSVFTKGFRGKKPHALSLGPVDMMVYVLFYVFDKVERGELAQYLNAQRVSRRFQCAGVEVIIEGHSSMVQVGGLSGVIIISGIEDVLFKEQERFKFRSIAVSGFGIKALGYVQGPY